MWALVLGSGHHLESWSNKVRWMGFSAQKPHFRDIMVQMEVDLPMIHRKAG